MNLLDHVTSYLYESFRGVKTKKSLNSYSILMLRFDLQDENEFPISYSCIERVRSVRNVVIALIYEIESCSL